MATAFETWNGSVWVVVTVGMRPIRSVTGATRDAISSASRRPRTSSVRSSGPNGMLDCSANESSIVAKSMPRGVGELHECVQYPG